MKIKIILFVLIQIMSFQFIFAQRKSTDFFGIVSGAKTNISSFPVLLANEKPSMVDGMVNIGLGFTSTIKGKFDLGFKFAYGYSPTKNKKNNYGFYSGNYFCFGLGYTVISHEKFEVNTRLNLGFQGWEVVYTNDTNNTQSSLNSGTTNEITFLVDNLMVNPEVNFIFKLKKNTRISVFVGYYQSLHQAGIFNYSNKRISNLNWSPQSFEFGLRYSFVSYNSNPK